MNNNYYYHKYDNNFRMNFKNISYQEWVNDNLDNLNYLNNIFIDICYKYNINFSKKKYDQVLDDLNFNMYLNNNQ